MADKMEIINVPIDIEIKILWVSSLERCLIIALWVLNRINVSVLIINNTGIPHMILLNSLCQNKS